MMIKILPVTSEVINGSWVLLATSLAIISLVYIVHEFRARGFDRPWTGGMRLSLALIVISIGVSVSHFPIWELRHFDSDSKFGDWRVMVMASGAFTGAIGFLIANREISRQLYGNGPWIATAASLVAFWVATVVSYYW